MYGQALLPKYKEHEIPMRPLLRRRIVSLHKIFLPAQNSSPVAATTGDVQTAQVVDNHPWWFWPVALLFFCFILGIIAVMAGVGGGVLFVPLVSASRPTN